MTASKLLQFFDNHRERAAPLVLVTVIETRGSTYSKSGAQMLINADGVFRGMLSGGCLEGDLAVRAEVVLDSGDAQAVTYDLAVDDELWGLGVGCDGMLRVQLQALRPEDAYSPFAEVADLLRGGEPGRVRIPLGCEAGGEITIDVRPPPNILILGAGLDVVPLVRIASELGWRCTVCDHRPAYFERGDLPEDVATHCIPAAAVGSELNLADFDAAIVMSHHLASDRTYLEQLSATSMAYVGLLGPAGRRERLLEELGDAAAPLVARLHGPAGLDLGGRGPEPIALSIAAELQQVLAGS